MVSRTRTYESYGPTPARVGYHGTYMREASRGSQLDSFLHARLWCKYLKMAHGIYQEKIKRTASRFTNSNLHTSLLIVNARE
jgi:hypothetical protein